VLWLTGLVCRLFSKLAVYCGRSLNNLIAPPSDDGASAERHVFRLQGSRVFYLPLKLANLAVSVPRANLLSAGTMIGKFTKVGMPLPVLVYYLELTPRL
jgi:60S ribosome subunit biogenesis protein NIP7